jgi:hypothetical protein
MFVFGRSPTGRAIRYNFLLVTSQKISAAIPNADNQELNFKYPIITFSKKHLAYKKP